MDVDLTEYDQFDEIKIPLNCEQPLNATGALPPLVTSNLDLTELIVANDDANCENDFVFLPRPTNLAKIPIVRQKQQQATTICRQQLNAHQPALLRTIDDKLSNDAAKDAVQYHHGQHHHHHHQQQPMIHPLMAINSNGGNPFYNSQQYNFAAPPSQPAKWLQPQYKTESTTGNPIGLLDIDANVSTNPTQLADLMHQIITKSDSIYIAVPCDHCFEQIVCPPSDLSAWLDHMYRQHNCKVCPICNLFVGLGPKQDLDIMRSHVVGHINKEWFDKKANKVSFTFGLQKHWFSGGKCKVQETTPHHRTLGLFRS